MASQASRDHPSIAGIRLVLGGNVFGWTIDDDGSYAVLDAFYEAGGRMIDTAEGYSAWVPGHVGGESERVIGAWLESRGVRADMRIGTKTGMGGSPGSLRPENVARALQGSLERLRTDYVDLYYIHRDDRVTPFDEVVTAYDTPFRAGSRARAWRIELRSAETGRTQPHRPSECARNLLPWHSRFTISWPVAATKANCSSFAWLTISL